MQQEIIYIIGSGRSGTSLLDIILGNSKTIFSLGEVNRFTKRDGQPHSPRDENVSGFWGEVNNKMKKLHYKSPNYYYKLFSKFEYHSGIFRVLFSFLRNKTELKNYAVYQNDLFNSIGKTISPGYNKAYFIDSSKYPVRAFFLSLILPDATSGLLF